jgi:hypothetical protein
MNKQQAKMPSIGKQFGLVFVVALPLAFILQWYLERSGNSDVLGLWYTIFCAIGYSILVAAIFAATAALRRRIRG